MLMTEEELKEDCQKLTRLEIAEKYRVHPETISKYERRYSVYALKRSLRTGKSVFSRSTEDTSTWHFLPTGEQTVKAGTNGAFTFIAYCNDFYKIKCNTCHNETIKSQSSIRNYTIPYCPTCKARQQAEEEAERIRARKEAEKLLDPAKAVIKICPYCEHDFLTENKKRVFCSKECKKKQADHKRKAKIKEKYFDSGISLVKVYQKHKGICAMCGKTTSFLSIKEDGKPAELYPSIDHIKPISRGGLHVWENTQLLCMQCNREKGAKTQ